MTKRFDGDEGMKNLETLARGLAQATNAVMNVVRDKLGFGIILFERGKPGGNCTWVLDPGTSMKEMPAFLRDIADKIERGDYQDPHFYPKA